MEQKEGMGTKAFKKGGGQAGSRGGCLKKGGGGAGTLLRTIFTGIIFGFETDYSDYLVVF